MINQDFMEYPEHRTGFYKLLTAINKTCFPGSPPQHSCSRYLGADISRTALLTLPPTQFKLLIDSIVWGMKHTMRDIAEIALNRRPCTFLVLRRSLTALPLASSVLGSRQQFLHRGPSSVKPVLPTILFKHHARRVLRVDRYGPQEWIQTPEHGPCKAVPTRADRSDRGSIIRSLDGTRPEHVQLALLAGIHCDFTQERFPTPATVRSIDPLPFNELPTDFSLGFKSRRS